MPTSILLTGLSDDAVTRIRYWSELNGMTAGQYVEHLVELYERLREAGMSREDAARRLDAAELLGAASLT